MADRPEKPSDELETALSEARADPIHTLLVLAEELANSGRTKAARVAVEAINSLPRTAETDEQAAARSALMNLLTACDKVPVARFNIGGFACPHCGAKADEKCRKRCWYPALEAAIEDAKTALAKARGGEGG